MSNKREFVQNVASLVFVLLIAIGGFFQPLLGFAVALLLLVAIVMNFRRHRSFCSKVCPRGRALDFALQHVSRRQPLPAFLRTLGSRRILCGFMMFCVIGSSVRLYSNIPALGAFFWSLCIISLSAGVVLGIFYKPRAWCAVCPMGTLQDTLGGRKE